ncbi:MAG: hypothetical protein KDA21_05895 [Phycisphaerales bacterium]|nr:hypothetical protein [Phycisphaerales bacterium]
MRRPGAAITRPQPRSAAGALLLAACVAGGCASERARPLPAFQSYDFASARDLVRAGARRRPPDENVLLQNAHLGMAAVADGDVIEAIDALEQAYRIQESGEVNDPGRVFAATVIWEGVKVWKGEPFEQALLDHALAVTYALDGDWENVRVAARAANRRLMDYARARDEDASYGSESFPVETDDSAAWLLEAIADRVLNEESNALRSVLSLRPDLEPLAYQLEAGTFDTILIVDWGVGPEKVPTGSDGESTAWMARDSGVPPLTVGAASFDLQAPPVIDTRSLAAEHRWLTAQETRQVKSALGTGLVFGGATVAAVSDHEETQWLGLGLMLAGMLTKSTAAADVRFNELLPAATYISLLDLGVPGPVTVRLGGTSFVVPDVFPGGSSDPAVIYLRLFGAGQSPGYFAATEPLYTNDHTGTRPGQYPYILGGTCVATPSQSVLEMYQAGGYLLDLSLEELRELYSAEGITLGSGPSVPSDRVHEVYRHVLEGGRALYTPAPYTVGYKRVMCTPHAPWKPRSERVRALAESIRRAHAGSGLQGDEP